MAPLTPFAYGPVAGLLAATDDCWVCVSGDEEESPLWAFEAAAPVAGVRNTRDGVLAVDANGLLTRLRRADGIVIDRTETGFAASGLAATEDGAWAVLHDKGVCVWRSAGNQFNINVAGAACVALDETCRRLGVATRDGAVHALDLYSGARHRLGLKTPIVGLAWSRLGWWYINTPGALYRADADLGIRRKLCDWDAEAAGCAASPEGWLCAVRLGQDRAALVGASGEALGQVTYKKRVVGEIEFGPFPWLGVGIGQGDGNRFSLVEADQIFRTDPPPGRPRNSWALVPGFHGKRVLREQEKQQSRAEVAAAADDVPVLALASDEAVEEPQELLAAGEAADGEPPTLESADESPPQREPRADWTPPFVLAPGERVLLRGGFGGAGWGWMIGIGIFWLATAPCAAAALWVGLSRGQWLLVPFGLAFLLVGLAVAAWPILRSGSYWLTNLRVHWKPRLGGAAAVPLAEIDPERVRVGTLTSSLHIRGRSPLSLRYIGGLERLWGGLELFGRLDELTATAGAAKTEEVACWFAYRVKGASSQLGMAVLRPTYFAFLPMEGKVNLVAKLAGGFANELAGKVIGVKLESVEAKTPVDLMLQVLYDRDPQSFDRYVCQAVEQQDGILREPGELTVAKEAFPLQPNRYLLLFTEKAGTVRGAPAREQWPFIDRVLPKWTGGQPLTVRQPVRGMVLVTLLLAVATLICLWNGLTWVNDPTHQVLDAVFMFILAGLFGLPALICCGVMIWVIVRSLRRPAETPS